MRNPNHSQLIQFTDKGFYCPQGDFYIDPYRGVPKAIITHAHSDHARYGSEHYLCHRLTKPLLQLRLGNNHYQAVDWGEKVLINGVEVSLHPSGHIIGASQVRIAYGGEVWVASGDYKTENDGLSQAFEPIPCHHFITESTFGLPIYQWKPQHEMYAQIQQWILHNQSNQCNSVLLAYSLGKAQRVIEAASVVAKQIFVHGAIYNSQIALQAAGISLTDVQQITPETPKSALKNAVIIAPPSVDGSPWLKKLKPYRLGVCSGWMQVRGNARRGNVDAGFPLSDHADWTGLLQAVKATGAEKVWVNHGFQSVLARYLNEQGIEAAEVKNEFRSVPTLPSTTITDDYGE